LCGRETRNAFAISAIWQSRFESFIAINIIRRGTMVIAGNYGQIGQAEKRNGRLTTRPRKCCCGKLKKFVCHPRIGAAARTQFERNEGDALITYEMEALADEKKEQGLESSPRCPRYCVNIRSSSWIIC